MHMRMPHSGGREEARWHPTPVGLLVSMRSQIIVAFSRFRSLSFTSAAALIAVSLAMSGCSSSRDPFAGIGSPVYPGYGPPPKGGGRYQLGDPYQVAGRWFTPKEQPDYDKVGTASWYGPKFNRRKTSNGEWFDMNYLSAAHPTLPLPSFAKVTNLQNGRTVVVRINDRGPFVGDRIIDLSKRAAQELDMLRKGSARVRVTYIGPAPLNDDGSRLAALNQALDHGSDVTTRYAALAKPAPRPRRPVVLAAAAVGQNGYFVQVGAYADPANVARARARLADVGPLIVSPVNGLYRVRLGPLDSVDIAQYALSRVRAAGHTDARLVLAQD